METQYDSSFPTLSISRKDAVGLCVGSDVVGLFVGSGVGIAVGTYEDQRF